MNKFLSLEALEKITDPDDIKYLKKYHSSLFPDGDINMLSWSISIFNKISNHDGMWKNVDSRKY